MQKYDFFEKIASEATEQQFCHTDVIFCYLWSSSITNPLKQGCMIRICQLMVMKLGICVQSCPSLFQLKSRRNKFKYIRVKKIFHMTSDILKVKLTIIFSVSYCAKILSGKCKNSQQYKIYIHLLKGW